MFARGFRNLCASREHGNEPVAVFKLANNQFRFEKCAFRNDETSVQKRGKGKSHSQSGGFGDLKVCICWIRHANSAKDKSAPRRVHGAPDLEFGAQRSSHRVSDTLLNAIRLQVQIDAKKDNCRCRKNASRNEKKSLGKCGHAGKLRNFSGM